MSLRTYQVSRRRARINHIDFAPCIRTIFRVLTNKLPYSPSLYGISPSCAPDTISEFLLISHNTYSLRTITGFIDAAWGIVDTQPLKQPDIEPEKIQLQVKQDLHFQNDLLAGGMAKKVR